MRRTRALAALVATALALIVTGCSSAEPEGIPETWEHGNWNGVADAHDWLVDGDQYMVSAEPKQLNESLHDVLLDGTDDERAAVLDEFAAWNYGIEPGEGATETIDLDVDGVAVRVVSDRRSPGDEVVFLQLTGSTTVWLLYASPLHGEIDSYFLKHFVPEFDPDGLPPVAEFEGILLLPDED